MFANFKKLKNDFTLIAEDFNAESTSGKIGFILIAVLAVFIMTSCYVVPFLCFTRYVLTHGHDTYAAGLLVAAICYSVGNFLSWLVVKAGMLVEKIVKKAIE